MEKKITTLIESTLNDLGFRLVQLVIGRAVKRIEIFIEKLDGSKISVRDCQLVSHNVSTLLDVENITTDRYLLEVSSAGIERNLVTLQDFTRHVGSVVKIRLKEPHNGNLSFKGILLSVHDGKVQLQSKHVVLGFDLTNISKAHLVLTDEMFRMLLKKGKKNKLKGKRDSI